MKNSLSLTQKPAKPEKKININKRVVFSNERNRKETRKNIDLFNTGDKIKKATKSCFKDMNNTFEKGNKDVGNMLPHFNVSPLIMIKSTEEKDKYNINNTKCVKESIVFSPKPSMSNKYKYK